MRAAICICFIHNSLANMKSMAACPQFSVHLQILLFCCLIHMIQQPAVQFASVWLFFSMHKQQKELRLDFLKIKSGTLSWAKVSCLWIFSHYKRSFLHFILFEDTIVAFNMCPLKSPFSCVCCRVELYSPHSDSFSPSVPTLRCSPCVLRIHPCSFVFPSAFSVSSLETALNVWRLPHLNDLTPSMSYLSVPCVITTPVSRDEPW